jgi:GTPase SAR1 family protein
MPTARVTRPSAVVLVGDTGVGKTNLLATFAASDATGSVPTDAEGVSAAFSSVRKPTIGVEFGTKIVRHPTTGKRIKAQIWDTGGLSPPASLAAVGMLLTAR